MADKAPTPQQLHRMIRRTMFAGGAAIVAVLVALGIFVYASAIQQDRICGIVEDAVVDQANALISATALPADATPEQIERRKVVEARYLGGIRESFEEC